MSATTQKSSQKLAGKVAVVTGASKGIGAEIARQLGAAGASVVVNYSSSKSGADRVVADVTAAGGKAVAVQADVSQAAEVSRLFADTDKAFGRVDVLVNNAGIYEFSPLDGVTPEHFHKQFNLNVLGLLLASQEAARRFGDKGGSIINISSAVTAITPANTAVYTATKGAVDAITGVLAKELGPKKVRVNAINPGMIETEGVRSAGLDEGNMRTWIEQNASLGRIGKPEEIAPAAVFLASDDSSYLTGETIRISGGL